MSVLLLGSVERSCVLSPTLAPRRRLREHTWVATFHTPPPVPSPRLACRAFLEAPDRFLRPLLED
jgi:hypothetical protein